MFDSRAEYLTQREAAIGRSGHALYRSQASSSIVGWTAGTTALRSAITCCFDEADQLPGAAALQSDLEIKGATLKELGVEGDTTRDLGGRVVASKDAEPEQRAAAKMILEALDEPAWFHTAGRPKTAASSFGIACRGACCADSQPAKRSFRQRHPHHRWPLR